MATHTDDAIPGPLLSSAHWLNYFRANSANLMEIPWEQGGAIPQEQRRAIAASIAEFQLGESSEGRHLVFEARKWAYFHDDMDYAQAIVLFIKEEQRHARDLARFMDQVGIARAGHTWSDAAFRWLRHRAGLETSIAVLVTAEVIAKVYYAALRDATGSAVLRQLCDQILRDEEQHVRFQSQRLALIRQDSSLLHLMLAHGLQSLLFAGACLVVWPKHKKALAAGGFNFWRFWHHAWMEFHRAGLMMDPRNYRDVREAVMAGQS